MKVLLCTSAASRARYETAFAQALPDFEFFWRDAQDPRLQAGAPQAEVAVVWKPCEAVFAEQRSLRAVFNLGAGVDALLGLRSLPSELPIYRLEDAGMAVPMARYALAAVLRHELRFDAYAQDQAARRWSPCPPRSAAQMLVGVLGLGAIGSTVATTLAQAGYPVRGYARSRHALPGVVSYAEDELAIFLEGLNVLINVLPLTPATTGLLNAQTLGRLAHGAHLINLARGAHLVEADLLPLIDAGQLSGATLDVLASEPLPSAHPFWQRPEILITPHVSGLTDVGEAAQQIAHKLRAWSRGEAVSGLVERQRGY